MIKIPAISSSALSLPSLLLPPVGISCAMAANTRYRLYRQICRRIEEFEFHLKEAPDKLFWRHIRHKFYLRSLVNQLDINSLIPHSLYLDIKNKFELLGKAEYHMQNIFGYYLKPSGKQMSSDEIAFMKQLTENGRLARVSEYKWRLESAIVEAAASGWFCVFQTLTVRPGEIDNVFSTGSKRFSDYIRDLERRIGATIYGSQRAGERARSQGHKFHKYLAVVERGSINNRLHIHVLHMCEKLPLECMVDPNAGRSQPTLTLVNKFSNWKHGFQQPIACRFEADDAFSHAGWRWPVKKDLKKYLPISANPPMAIARYISKYVAKEYCNSNEKGQFRCRMTRSLGLNSILSLMEQAPTKMVITLAINRDNNPFRIDGQATVPTSLIRKLAVKEMLNRIPSKMVWTYLQELTPQEPIIKQYRKMILQKCSHSSMNIGDIRTKTLIETETFDRTSFVDLAAAWKECVLETRQGFSCGGDTTR